MRSSGGVLASPVSGGDAGICCCVCLSCGSGPCCCTCWTPASPAFARIKLESVRGLAGSVGGMPAACRAIPTLHGSWSLPPFAWAYGWPTVSGWSRVFQVASRAVDRGLVFCAVVALVGILMSAGRSDVLEDDHCSALRILTELRSGNELMPPT